MIRFKNIITSVFLLLAFLGARAQMACTSLGQNPSTGFPVCGTNAFSQTIVPECGGRPIHDPCFFKDGIQKDANPYWYKFTCFQSGTLGFLITPGDLGDDYDWELFDITGRAPIDVYEDSSLVVGCNWSGNKGITGTADTGVAIKICSIENLPPVSAMPALITGHNYLLLVSHYTKFTPSETGYTLVFGGGTAGITDTLPPAIAKIGNTCDASQVLVKLNKKMKCSSLAADGSDFALSAGGPAITGATGNGCATGFDFDTVAIALTNPLQPGSYFIAVKNGSDANTLLDYCDRAIPAAANIPFQIVPPGPTPMDSISPVSCRPGSVKLVFDKRIRCSSIAADGSDFTVTGPAGITVTGATGNCIGELSDIITITFSAPITNSGSYQVKLVAGTDGNTIVDECGQESIAGTSLNFTTIDTVSADFTYTVLKGCTTDTVQLFHDGKNGVGQWLWDFGNGGTSNQQNATAYFPVNEARQIKLIVSNAACSDSAVQAIPPGGTLNAAFETSSTVCPKDPVIITNNSTGDINRYFWDFGNGVTTTAQTVTPFNYPSAAGEKTYLVRLIVSNATGCADTAMGSIKVLLNCSIEVPAAFTPNGDGLNDYLYPLNISTADNFEFSVYNRYGQLLFYTKDATKKWDGQTKGKRQNPGAYVWILKYIDRSTNRQEFRQGTTVLMR